MGRHDVDPEIRFLAGTMLFSLYHCIFSLFFTSTISRFPRAFQIINVVWISFPFLIISLIFHTSYFCSRFSLIA